MAAGDFDVLKKTRSTIRRTGATVAAVMVVAFTAMALVAPGGTASGQTDPYATTTSTTQATTTTTGGVTCRITIEISINRGNSGIRIRVRARCFPPGAQVTFTFNGTKVGQSLSTPGGGTAAGLPEPLAAVLPSRLLRAVQPQTAAEPVAEVFFDIPAVSPGTYPVCAFSDGVAPVCTSFQVTAAGSSGTSRGFLATTGRALLGLTAIGLVALAAGWVLRMSSRRRHSV
jgi:hypothetical protein